MSEVFHVSRIMEIVNSLNCPPIMGERNNFNIVVMADFHEFAILNSPLFAKKSIHLCSYDSLNDAVSYSPKHAKECWPLIHALLSRQSQIRRVHNNQFFRPAIISRERYILLHLRANIL